jgi:site-specific DNA recombinase
MKSGSQEGANMRAALYARFSTELQRGESLDDQFRQCGRVAAVQGLEVVGRFSDAAISGGTAERPGYQAMLAAARAGAFDVVVVEDLSRLWRSRSAFGRDSSELEDLNIHLLTCTGDDTRRDGYGLVLGIKSAIAEHQRREIAYRTRRGMEGLAAVGKSTGGRCYGYGSPEEAETVRWLYRSRAMGVSVRSLVYTLNRDGVPAPRGPRWSYNAVKRILANQRYAGRLQWGRTQRRVGALDGRRQRPVMQPQPLVDRAAPELALVDPEIWAHVQKLSRQADAVGRV